MSDRPLTRQQLLDALDLLDELVDGNMETVTKARVDIWKRMMRNMVTAEEPIQQPHYGVMCPTCRHYDCTTPHTEFPTRRN